MPQVFNGCSFDMGMPIRTWMRMKCITKGRLGYIRYRHKPVEEEDNIETRYLRRGITLNYLRPVSFCSQLSRRRQRKQQENSISYGEAIHCGQVAQI